MTRIEQNLCSSWSFHLEGDDARVRRVDLPHTWNARDLPEAGTHPVPLAEGEGAAVFAGYGVGEGDDYHRGTGCYTRVLPRLDRALGGGSGCALKPPTKTRASL